MMHQALPYAKAITALLHPYAEVVIHDLESGKIAAIFGNFSKRKVGDSSLIESVEVWPDYFEPYTKAGPDGRLLKSTTVTIRDDAGKAVGLLCINIDLAPFEQVKGALESFLQTSREFPEALFKDDWREKISLHIQDYLKKRSLTLARLSRTHKEDLISHLYAKGAFAGKDAARHVASLLGVSRTTIYNYLKRRRPDAPAPI